MTDFTPEYIAEQRAIAERVPRVAFGRPYITDNGGIVDLQGPYDMEKARQIVEYRHAAANNYSAALDEIERLQGELTRAINVDIEKTRELRALRDELAALKEANRWIPVEECRPEDGIDVLVTGEYFTSSMSWDTRHVCWRNTVGIAYAIDSVTHWRPLPTPPDEEPK